MKTKFDTHRNEGKVHDAESLERVASLLQTQYTVLCAKVGLIRTASQAASELMTEAHKTKQNLAKMTMNATALKNVTETWRIIRVLETSELSLDYAMKTH